MRVNTMSDYNEEEIIQMINDCAERESKLNDWERGFISSVGDKADKGIMLSARQREILNKTWERVA